MNENYEIVVSGEKWIGEGIVSTRRVINELIEESYESLVLTIYVLNNSKVLNNIEKALDRNIRVDIFINYETDSYYKSIYNKLNRLKNEYDNLNIYEGTEEFIHAKIIIKDSQKILIGSANLTYSGLTTNYELGILIEDKDISGKVDNIIRRLVK